MEGTDGAWCDGIVLRFRHADPGRTLAAVRVLSSAFRADLRFRAEAGVWELRRERPPLWRLDYRLELIHRDGTRAETASRELRCPGYTEPDWLSLPPAPGAWRSLRLPLGDARVWSPRVPTDRVLVAHDGPDYQRCARLADYTAAVVGSGRVPAYHLVLLPIGDRERRFSADPGYARVLARETLPWVRARLGGRRVVGAGASLGALAMLHAQRAHPDAFAGLFLQSGSYFRPRYDSPEPGFRHWGRIVRFVREVRHARSGPAVPVTMTCGAAEENLANNRDMADALRKQGYSVAFAENPDAHTWTGWRDTLHPHLTGLLRRVWPD